MTAREAARAISGLVLGFAFFGLVYLIIFMIPVLWVAAPLVAGLACVALGLYGYRVFDRDWAAVAFGGAGLVGAAVFVLLYFW